MNNIEAENLVKWVGPLKTLPFPGLPSFSKSQNPLIEKNFSFVSAFKSKKVISFDRKNGKIRWTFDLGVYGGTPLVTDQRFVFVGTNRGVSCLNKKSGKMHWKYEPYNDEKESFYSEPVKIKGAIFTLDRYGFLHRLSSGSGKLKYRVQLSEKNVGQFNSKIATHSGKIYAISSKGFLVCVDMNSGDILLTTFIDEGSAHALIVSGNSLFIQGKACIFEINLKNKKAKKIKFQSVVDLYLKNDKFYVLDSKSKSETILFEYKKKKKKLFKFNGQLSSFVSFEDKNVLPILGYDGIIFFNIKNKIKNVLLSGIFSPTPYISKKEIFAIDLMHEFVCIKNPLDSKYI